MAIQTIKATMQMRYGLEEDLEPDQLTTGEWAVSTDTKKIWMCFAPGLVRRMATYEAFEQDMVEIQTILATCRDIQTAVEAFEQLAEQHKDDAASSALLSESWAHGETGIREGETKDNSKYWSEQSKSEANRAREEADRAAAVVGFNIDAELSETSTNPVQNKVITGNFNVIVKELNKKLNKTGDASEVNAIFSQPESRSNIASGEKLSVIFGKIQRFFEDIKTVAFTGKFSDLSDAPQAVNNLASDSETDFLAAIQGKILDAKLAELNGKYIFVEIPVTIPAHNAGYYGYAYDKHNHIPEGYTPELWCWQTGSLAASNGMQVSVTHITLNEYGLIIYAPIMTGIVRGAIKVLCKKA